MCGSRSSAPRSSPSLVYVLGGSRGATPVRLALAGTALTAALFGYINAVKLMDTAALDKMRFWTVGFAGLGRHADGQPGRAVPRGRRRSSRCCSPGR